MYNSVPFIGYTVPQTYTLPTADWQQPYFGSFLNARPQFNNLGYFGTSYGPQLFGNLGTFPSITPQSIDPMAFIQIMNDTVRAANNYNNLQYMSYQNPCVPYNFNSKFDFSALYQKPENNLNNRNNLNNQNSENNRASGSPSERLLKMVEIAKAEARRNDNVETNGNNDSSRIRVYKHGARNSHQWCSYFTTWCAEEGLGSKMPFGWTGSSQAVRKAAERAGKFSKKGTYTPRVGDIAIWTKQSDPAHGHIGIITKVTSSGVEITEGNSGNRVKTNTYSFAKLQRDGFFNGYVRMNDWVA